MEGIGGGKIGLLLRSIGGIGRAASRSCERVLLRYAGCCVLSRFDDTADDDCVKVSTMLPYMHG